jgi:putative endonuclease
MDDSFWVYIVLCSDASFYTGITNNVERRLWQHNNGIDRFCYTYTRQPVRLVYAAEFHDSMEAIRWEKQIKGWSRAKKNALVRGDWKYIREASRQ